jgi:hypothetical protein
VIFVKYEVKNEVYVLQSIWHINKYSQLSIIQGNGGEEGHGQTKTTVKKKAVKTWYEMDLMLSFF